MPCHIAHKNEIYNTKYFWLTEISYEPDSQLVDIVMAP